MNTCDLCEKKITQDDVKVGELQVVFGCHTVHKSCHESDGLDIVIKKTLWLAQSQLGNYRRQLAQGSLI